MTATITTAHVILAGDTVECTCGRTFAGKPGLARANAHRHADAENAKLSEAEQAFVDAVEAPIPARYPTAHDEIFVTQEGRTWLVWVQGDVASKFTSKAKAIAEANAEADAALTRVAALVEHIEAAVEARTVDVDPVLVEITGPTRDEIEAMDQTARYAAAKAENDARKAWVAAGCQGDAPATPVLDWMKNPAMVGATPKVKRTGTSTGGRTVERTADEISTMERVIREGVAAGRTWAQIGRDMVAAGAPAPHGGKWYPVRVHQLAVRNGWATD